MRKGKSALENGNQGKATENDNQRPGRVGRLLGRIEERLNGEADKATLAEYVRLTQLEQELADEQPPSEMKVKWIEALERSLEE